ncbi:SMI1/KNR4 family protein [Pseudomonas wadenswilerensis]
MDDISNNFKKRFSASVTETDPALHFEEFVSFDAESLPTCLPREDSSFLTTQGLPCDAAPFLSFYAYSQSEIESRLKIFGLPESCFPIGHNGSGDVVAIDMDSRQVVFFNHDFHNERVLINSSLPQFAESLCIFKEHFENKSMADCLVAIAAIDPQAAEPGSMWQAEVSAELAEES